MEIQLAIVKGKLELAASFMLVAENAKCPMQTAREYNLNFMYRYAKVYVSTQRIESLKPLVLQIMNTGIKRADATHIACTIDAGCGYFISVDDRVLKYRDDRIKVITQTICFILQRTRR